MEPSEHAVKEWKAITSLLFRQTGVSWLLLAAWGRFGTCSYVMLNTTCVIFYRYKKNLKSNFLIVSRNLSSP